MFIVHSLNILLNIINRLSTKHRLGRLILTPLPLPLLPLFLYLSPPLVVCLLPEPLWVSLALPLHLHFSWRSGGKGLNLGQLYFLLSRCTACVPQNPGLSLCSVAPPHRSSPDSLNENEVQQQCRDLFLLFIRLSVSYFSPILFLFHCMSVRPLL